MFYFIVAFCIFIICCFVYLYIKSTVCNIDEIESFELEFEDMKKNYISVLDKMDLINRYKPVREQFKLILNNRIKKFIYVYDNLDEIVEQLNDEFIKNEMIKCKDFFDNIFKYPIDDEQKKAIITDDNNNLIIAGAGSGKTTTIIGKTKYLIEQKNINPEEIITISFTNAAKDNFIEKLNDKRVYCSTFHKLGKDILEEDADKLDIVDSNYMDIVVKKYMQEELPKNQEQATNFIKFYSYYFHFIEEDKEKKIGEIIEQLKGLDLETLKTKYNNAKGLETFKGEKVKSEQELVIANFLFLHGINYEYEPKYKYNTANKYYRQYHPDFYLVDYDMYLEHFGINKSGRAPQYNEIEEKKYLEGIDAKRDIHKKNNTTMIETYSYDFDNYNIENILTKKLKERGIKLNTIDYKEVIDVITNVNSFDISEFYKLISKFIKMFKGNNYSYEKFDEFYLDAKKNSNQRNMIIIKLIKEIYNYYQTNLTKNNYIDFDDMINMATQKVSRSYNKKVSYIIIDEFQDVSYSRYSLIKAIQDKTNAKVVAVGDDWQSIYRFSGCDLDLFVNFNKYFLNPRIMYITNTYRNCQNLINISGNFIMKNENGQIKKAIKSDVQNIDIPIECFYYKQDIIKAVNDAIRNLKNIGCKKIAILGRNNFDIKMFGIEPTIDKKEIDLSKKMGEGVIFTTVHKSKGLEYDGVIICNLANYIAGFPNKMSDDPVLDYVTLSKDTFLYEEERRLFYVALTRTKTKCFLMVPIINPSVFVEELLEMKNSNIKKNIIEDDERMHNPRCPKCSKGILVIRTNGNDNTEFVGCSNYPLCDFNYKNDDIIKNNIVCPRCNSYMVKRTGQYGKFYGCINYPYCTQTIESEKKYNSRYYF